MKALKNVLLAIVVVGLSSTSALASGASAGGFQTGDSMENCTATTSNPQNQIYSQLASSFVNGNTPKAEELLGEAVKLGNSPTNR